MEECLPVHKDRLGFAWKRNVPCGSTFPAALAGICLFDPVLTSPFKMPH